MCVSVFVYVSVEGVCVCACTCACCVCIQNLLGIRPDYNENVCTNDAAFELLALTGGLREAPACEVVRRVEGCAVASVRVVNCLSCVSADPICISCCAWERRQMLWF